MSPPGVAGIRPVRLLQIPVPRRELRKLRKLLLDRISAFPAICALERDFEKKWVDLPPSGRPSRSRHIHRYLAQLAGAHQHVEQRLRPRRTPARGAPPRVTPTFLNDIVLRTTDTPIGVCPCLSGIGPRTKSDFVRVCPCLSGRSGVHGSFVGDPNQPVPDADPMHGNQIFHGAAERLVGAFLGPCR